MPGSRSGRFGITLVNVAPRVILLAMPELDRQNVFLTGASTGIGRATADRLLASGHEVWGTSRQPDRLPSAAHFHPVAMTLDDPASIAAAWAQAVREAGQIDVVIQNAGSGIVGSIEDVTSDEARRLWQILVEGPRQILQLAAAHLRPRRQGLIIGISSLAAELPLPFSAHYSAGKAALSSLLAGLNMELAPFNVAVVDLRPGDIRTDFIQALPGNASEHSAYAPWAGQAWREGARLMNQAPSPDLVAHAILKLLAQRHPPAVHRVGTFFQATLGPLGPRLLPQKALLASIRRYFGLDKIDRQHHGP